MASDKIVNDISYESLKMDIQYYGHSCFRIKTKKAVIITDPYDDSVGFSLPKLKADIVTVSHQHKDHSNIKVISGIEEGVEPFIVCGPGEYEINEVYIWGIQAYHDNQKGKKKGRNTIYFFSAEGIRFCHLGDLGHVLNDKAAEKLSQTDVLFVPVGGRYTLDTDQAIKVVEKVNPNFVIPMHYQLPGSALELAPVADFLKKVGSEGVEPVDRLSIKTEMLTEETKVVVLKKK
ncbi:MBL fold metallo-hydrolase [Patescibacteria group bacterium]|nr:MBL fold metallo-hydrolase [Patescibacteria group bacterium]